MTQKQVRSLSGNLNKRQRKHIETRDATFQATSNLDKLNRLKKVTQAAGEIMAMLGRVSLDEVLCLIARHATEILEAEAGSICLVKRPGVLTFEAGFGYGEGGIQKGREFAIRTGKRAGLTGHIAYEGRLFNAHGDDLVNHPAVRGVEMPYMASKKCYSMLAMPLMQQVGAESKLIGLLRIDNKKNHAGEIGPDYYFKEEDEWIVRLFAETVVTAIESAQMVAELSAREDQFSRLVATSMDGVIVNNREGKILVFNQRAQAILGYEPEAILGKQVSMVFANPRETRRIHHLLLQSADGYVKDLRTALLTRTGKPVPIRLSATWLYNARRERIGVVGYFEDLRVLEAAQQRLDLLLDATNLLTQADNLRDGLQDLARMMVNFWGTTYCRIFLLDHSQQFLTTEAVYPLPEESDFEWRPNLKGVTAVADWPRLDELLAKHEASIIRITGRQGRYILQRWTDLLELSQDIQSELVVPLRTNEKAVGLLELGELRSWDVAPFTEEQKRLAIAIAEQTAVLIDRLQLHEQTERRRKLLETLDETSRRIRAVNEMPKLLQEVVRLTANLANCTVGGLYINSPHLGELTLSELYGLPIELVGSTLNHAEGMIGQAARTGETCHTNEYPVWPNREEIFQRFKFETFVALPLRHAGVVEAVLFVADQESCHRLLPSDIEILNRFAVHASTALHTSQMMSREQRLFSQLAILHRISNYIQATADLEKILHVVLTGVTAGYGLGFNRAAILLLDDTGTCLIGRMAIGHFEEQQVYKDWQRDHREGYYDFGRYLELLDMGELTQTPLGTIIHQLRIPIKTAAADLFSAVMVQGRSKQVTQYDFDQLPPSFIQLFQPDWPLIIAPLLTHGKVIGLLVADNKFTQLPITREDEEQLLTFANTAAISIEKATLLNKTERSRAQLEASFAASNALVLSRDPDKVWRDIVEKAQDVADASGVRMFLIDVDTGQVRDLVVSESDNTGTENLIRPNGLSMAVVRTGNVQIVNDFQQEKDRANPSFFDRGIRAAIGLPVSVDGRREGVMWIYYDEPRHFSPSEVQALQLYVNQAAIAYENARRLKELEHIQQAAEALAGAADLSQVLHQIVASACHVLQANWAFIWSYDDARMEFDLENSVATGIADELWQQYRKVGPRRGGTAATAMQRGWIGVRDMNDEAEYPFIGKATRALLRHTGVRSFQGIALRVGDEKLGVLYVNYNHSRSFPKDEQKIAQTFANHAALALRNARLLSRLNKARRSASVVADLTTLANLEDTLQSVVLGMRDTLRCDVVTVYVYDQEKQMLLDSPTASGARYPNRFSEKPSPDSPVFHVLRHGPKIYIADDVTDDPLFANSRFSREEGIASCVAVRLRVGVATVGVMFINYRTPHHFTDDELDHIELFANQAAVAIHNAHLFERKGRRTAALEAIYLAGRAVSSTLELDEILNRIAEQAWYLVSFPDRTITYSSIWLAESEHTVRIVGAYPSEELQRTQDVVGPTVSRQNGQNGRSGIMWRAIRKAKPELVQNVHEDPDYLASHAETRSELVVPIILEDEVIGIINVEHSVYDAFDAENIRALEALADQAAIAIQNAKLYKTAVRHAQLLDAAARVASRANSILDESQLLDDIVQVITDSMGYYHAAVFLMEDNREYVSMRAASSENGRRMVEAGHRLRVGAEGIVGYVARAGQYLLIPDVTQDKRHLANTMLPDTCAEMAFPLIARGRVIGVLDVQDDANLNLSDEDVSTLQTLANQLANAIHNAQLFNKAQIQSLTLEALYEAGQAVSSSLEIDQILATIVEKAWQLTGTRGPQARFSCLLLQNGDKLEFEAAYPPETLAGLRERVGAIRIEGPGPVGITGRTFLSGEPQLVADVTKNSDYLAYDEETRSELAVPIQVGDEVIGVINVEHPQVNVFDDQDQDALVMLAAQAGIAIQNAHAFRDVHILQTVSASLAGALALEDVLSYVIEAAIQLTNTTSGSILFWDEENEQYKPAYTVAGPGQKLSLYETTARITGGCTRYVIENKVPFIIYDTRVEENINPTLLKKKRRSLIGVPVLSEGKVIAVLHVYSQDPRQVTEHQVTLLEALASQAGVAITKAQAYEELKATKGLVGARTALAWMGMASNAWRHRIEGDAVTIRNTVELLHPVIKTAVSNAKALADAQEKLDLISRLAVAILDRPITPPLSSEEGAMPVHMNDLIRERMGQLWEGDRYEQIEEPVLNLDETEQVTVWASAEWLRLALDLVVDNAVDAMRTVPKKQLTVETAVVGEHLEIAIKDTGPGIPPEVLPSLFQGDAPQTRRQGHLGRGLLMVQAITHTYGGDVGVQETGPQGTSMVLSFPIFSE